MQKVVQIGTKARDKVLKGANFLADAVRSTLGPYGANAMIEKGNRVTNDGVTIAREISLKDELENRGVCILRETAIRTNDEAGDGTTTAITLGQAILKEAIRLLPNEKTVVGKKTPIEIIETLERERKEVTEKLVSMHLPIKSKEELIASARVSVEDETLAELIGGTQWDLGKEGIIIAEEVAEPKSSIERVHGIRIDNGLGASLMMNNEERQSLEVEKVRIILTNHTLQNLNPLKPVLDQLHKSGVRNLIIVARAFTSECVQTCAMNIKNGFNIYPINAPYTDQNEVMKDLASVLGARYINSEEGELEDMNLTDVGFAEKVVARRYDAVFTGKSDEMTLDRIEMRAKELKDKITGEASAFEKKNVQTRLSQLTNGFAILKIGATSETERKYKKDKADDAVNAVRAALQEGVVPGAGLAFKQISDSLPESYLLKRPLLSIYEQITSTAPADFIIPEWVRDPVKVLRVALEKACSVAGIFASTGIVIATENPKPRFVEEVTRTEDNQ